MLETELAPLEEDLAGKNYRQLLCLSALYQGMMGDIAWKIKEEGRSDTTSEEAQQISVLKLRYVSIRQRAKILHALDTINDPKSRYFERREANWTIWLYKVNTLAGTMMDPHPEERAYIDFPGCPRAPQELPEVDEIAWATQELPKVLPQILSQLPTPDGEFMTAEEFMQKMTIIDGVDGT